MSESEKIYPVPQDFADTANLSPERYQEMPKWEALKLLYKTSRIYKNKTELVHPKTGEVYQTIGVDKFQ